MALPATLNPSSPAGTDSPAQGDDSIRDIKNFVIDVLGIPNNSAVTAAAFAITTAGVVTASQSPFVVPTEISFRSTNTSWLTGASGPLIIRTLGTSRWTFDQSGMLWPVTSNLDIGTTSGPNPRFVFVGDEVVLSDAGANATAGGRLRRSGANLTWHDGTQVVNLNGGLNFVLRPESATFGSANFAALVKNSGVFWHDYTLDYDQTTEESAFWYAAIPTNMTVTTATAEIYSRQASVTSGTVAWNVLMAARASGMVWDAGGVTNLVAAATVQGTAGQILRQGAVLSTTGISAARALQVRVSRDVAADSAAEDAKLIETVIRIT